MQTTKKLGRPKTGTAKSSAERQQESIKRLKNAGGKSFRVDLHKEASDALDFVSAHFRATKRDTISVVLVEAAKKLQETQNNS